MAAADRAGTLERVRWVIANKADVRTAEDCWVAVICSYYVKVSAGGEVYIPADMLRIMPDRGMVERLWRKETSAPDDPDDEPPIPSPPVGEYRPPWYMGDVEDDD